MTLKCLPSGSAVRREDDPDIAATVEHAVWVSQGSQHPRRGDDGDSGEERDCGQEQERDEDDDGQEEDQEAGDGEGDAGRERGPRVRDGELGVEHRTRVVLRD